MYHECAFGGEYAWKIHGWVLEKRCVEKEQKNTQSPRLLEGRTQVPDDAKCDDDS